MKIAHNDRVGSFHFIHCQFNVFLKYVHNLIIESARMRISLHPMQLARFVQLTTREATRSKCCEILPRSPLRLYKPRRLRLSYVVQNFPNSRNYLYEGAPQIRHQSILRGSPLLCPITYQIPNSCKRAHKLASLGRARALNVAITKCHWWPTRDHILAPPAVLLAFALPLGGAMHLLGTECR